MKINKLFIYLLLALPAFFLQSCQIEDEKVFDKPYSERMEEFLQAVQDTLIASQYGWALDYYPQGDQKYGGVAYTIKFTRDNAIVRFENNPDDGEVKSLYKLKKDNGPVLSFDTHNAFMHTYATPSDGQYRGKEGDFEFVIDSIGSDRIKVHGKRSLNTMYLRKLSADATEYMEKVTEHTNLFVFSDVTLNVGGKPYTLKVTDRENRQLSFLDGDKVVSTSAYAFTNKGIRLYEPITLNGVEMSDLTFDVNSLKFSAKDVESTQSNIDVDLIARTIGDINASNVEKSITKFFPYLDKLNITCDASWVHLTTDNGKLTVNLDANPNATKARGARIKISNGVKESQVQVAQFDLPAILGIYQLKMKAVISNDGDLGEVTRTAQIKYEGSGQDRKFFLRVANDGGSPYVFPLVYLPNENVFLMPSVKKVFTYKDDKNTFYIYNTFYIGEDLSTGLREDVYNVIKFNVSDNGEISASLGGPLVKLSNGQIQNSGLVCDRIILIAFKGEPISQQNIAGRWDSWINPVLKKRVSPASAAKPSVLLESSIDKNVSSLTLPQYLPNRVARFDAGWNGLISSSSNAQLKLNK